MGPVLAEMEQACPRELLCTASFRAGEADMEQTFLLRHVYASTMDGLQLSRTSATFITFLLSACCHELVMAVVSKKIRPYLFLMQVSSALPLPWRFCRCQSLQVG